MPRQSINDLKNAIEAAAEMTDEHRAQLLALVDSLDKEVATTENAGPDPGAEKIRGAIAVAEDVVRRRAAGQEPDSGEDHDLKERLSELEEKVEMVALEHPMIANVLTAISRLA